MNQEAWARSLETKRRKSSVYSREPHHLGCTWDIISFAGSSSCSQPFKIKLLQDLVLGSLLFSPRPLVTFIQCCGSHVFCMTELPDLPSSPDRPLNSSLVFLDVLLHVSTWMWKPDVFQTELPIASLTFPGPSSTATSAPLSASFPSLCFSSCSGQKPQSHPWFLSSISHIKSIGGFFFFFH